MNNSLPSSGTGIASDLPFGKYAAQFDVPKSMPTVVGSLLLVMFVAACRNYPSIAIATRATLPSQETSSTLPVAC
jgi:hypothetical protein